MPESENHKILRIPYQNQEHNESLFFQLQNHENYKKIELHYRIKKIIKI